MKSILLTGGSGGFGQAFTERLLKENVARICIYSRGEHAQADMARRLKDHRERLRFFIGDIRDRLRLTRAADGCDVIVHAAALKRIEVGFYNPVEMVKTNVMGAVNVIEAARDAGVGKVVALSTDKAYEPISPYGHSKALAEALFLAANTGERAPRFALVRYGNVWCAPGSVVPTWKQMLEDGEEVLPVTDPDATRFFMWMHEAVDLVLDTIKTMKGGETAIPVLPAYRIGDLAEAMRAKTVTIGLPHYEKLHEKMNEFSCSKDARRMTIEELRAAL